MKEEGRVKGKDESVEGKRGGEEDDGCEEEERSRDRKKGQERARERGRKLRGKRAEIVLEN